MELLLVILLAGGIVGCLGDCPYYNSNYKVGESWTAVDHCNKCTCTHHGMQCSYDPCQNSGFAKPQEGRLGDCNYHGSWYLHHDQWLALDDCNTCVCQYPGNFLGLQVCTSQHCSNVVG